MTINFKVAVSEPNVLQKVLIDTVSLEGTLRNESPVSNPSILLETESIAIGDLVRSNYAYIPEFGRYYYIRECTHFVIICGLWIYIVMFLCLLLMV